MMKKDSHIFSKLDRYIGIPIVFILGFFKRKTVLPNIIKRVAVLNLGSIGDNVLMSTSVMDVRKAYPDSEIIIFTGSANYEIVKLVPEIDQVVKLKISNIFESYKKIRDKGKFDIVIDFEPGIYTFFFKSKYRIGFKTQNQYRDYIYDTVVDHEIDNHTALINLLHIDNSNNPQLINKEFNLSRLGLDKSKKIAIFHPWSCGLKKLDKQWSYDNWKDLYFNLSKDFHPTYNWCSTLRN